MSVSGKFGTELALVDALVNVTVGQFVKKQVKNLDVVEDQEKTIINFIMRIFAKVGMKESDVLMENRQDRTIERTVQLDMSLYNISVSSAIEEFLPQLKPLAKFVRKVEKQAKNFGGDLTFDSVEVENEAVAKYHQKDDQLEGIKAGETRLEVRAFRFEEFSFLIGSAWIPRKKGIPEKTVDFSVLNFGNFKFNGVTYANDRFYAVDAGSREVCEYNLQWKLIGCDSPHTDNSSPSGITYEGTENGERLWVVNRPVNSRDIGLFAYKMGDSPVIDGSYRNFFLLTGDNESPTGITYANDRKKFYVVDAKADKVYVYGFNGVVWTHYVNWDFALDSDNSDSSGITYANGRFYVVDVVDNKIYVYDSSGNHVSGLDFVLHADNSQPAGITYANNRLYVVDFQDGGIYDYDIPTIDLTVKSFSVSDTTLAAMDELVMRATVRNEGTAQSRSDTTRLRYYRSTNNIITRRDSTVGTDYVRSLDGAETSTETITIRLTEEKPGTYYYGACVDSVRGESNTANNCSDAVRVVVTAGSGFVTIPDANLRAVIADSLALVALYRATNGAQWANADDNNWNSNTPLNEWYGVSTNAQGRVDSLNLSENLLKGTLPDSLGLLTDLTYLDLRTNQLSGAIPSALSDLTQLQTLALHENQFSGQIPAELGNLTNLTYLTLHQNRLTGNIPEELGTLTNLTAELNLSRNQLTGTIPESLGNLTQLTELYLYDNQLTGSIPSALGNLTNLTELHLQDNELTGPIPLTFRNLTNLEHLKLGNNANLCLPVSMQTWAQSRQLSEAQSLPACSPITGVNIPERTCVR